MLVLSFRRADNFVRELDVVQVMSEGISANRRHCGNTAR